MICDKDSKIFTKWEEAGKEACVVDYCMNLMGTAKNESCGKCVLCREGTWQVYQIMRDITEGKAESEDFELLADLLGQIQNYASCEMSRNAAAVCMELLKSHEEEWDMHIRRKRCTNLVCKGTYTLYVDPDICDGCGQCLKSCPQEAIDGGDGLIHVIRTDQCNKSMVCVSVCPKAAIKKAGAVKPKIPGEPVPVGSFGASEGSGEGGGRRRRRRGDVE
ncbi:MAG TPA: 4Fe-4S binding protein [Clostridiales bacterium]|nr:4Fe-4S binding protein [Clostridiales bacterium]